jgi:hypothetical protein
MFLLSASVHNMFQPNFPFDVLGTLQTALMPPYLPTKFTLLTHAAAKTFGDCSNG